MPPQSTDAYHVGVVCALPKEMAAARAMLEREHKPLHVKDGQDSNHYVLGELHGHYVVIACLPAGEYGTNAAATVASDMLRTFTKIRFGLMVGIGGGVPNLADGQDIRLGDVVVSQPDKTHGGVVQYDLGKDLGSGQFERKGFLNGPPTLLLTALSSLQSRSTASQHRVADNVNRMLAKPDLAEEGYMFPGVDQDQLSCAACSWSSWQLWWWVSLLLYWLYPLGPCRICDCGQIPRSATRVAPRIHYGTIASGNCLIKNAVHRDRLRDEYGAKCVEMEAAGLMNNFPCLVIRGICDYADAHKNDKWQNYAAVTAAAFAQELLSTVSPIAVDASTNAVKIMNGIDELVKEGTQLQKETLEENRSQFKNVEARKQTQREQDCLQTFKTSPYESYRDHIQKRVAGTCRWVLEHPHFQRWHGNPDNDLLWISADPGCGKSVLCNSLIEHEFAALQRSTTCHYFFKDDGQRDRLAPALCAVLHQLFSDQPHLVRHAIPAWKKNGGKIREEVGAMWQILLDATSDEDASAVVCVFDALDECCDDDRRELVTRLCHFHEQSSKVKDRAALRFLVTSRPYDNVQRWFEQTTSRLPQVRLRGEDENDRINEEINLVIDERIGELAAEFALSAQHQDKLRQRLRRMKHRTYLWLYLAMEEMRRRYRDSMDPEEEPFKNIPTSVEEAYEQILQRITDQQKPQARRILLIIVGAQRPLTIGEAGLAFNSAIAYEKNQSDVRAPNVSHLERRVREWCGLFVFINHSQLFLIHQTAKEFLLTDLPTCEAGMSLWKSSLLTTHVEREMAIMCITYLYLARTGQHSLSQAPGSRDTNSDFFKYCAEHWISHLHDDSIMDSEKLLEMVLVLYNTVGERFYTWFSLMWKASHYDKDVPRVQDQHAIAMSGHAVVLAERYKRKQFEVDMFDDERRTALIWALEARHENVVQILLDKGADINGPEGSDRTPLQVASRQGNGKMVQRLLSNGADVDALGIGPHRSALQEASARNHARIVQMLLDRGADVNALGRGPHRSALQEALELGHARIVQMLLDGGADVNAPGRGPYGSVLQGASARGHAGIVQMLLDRGADANALGPGPYGSALEEASQHGHESIVQLLLDNGADVYAPRTNALAAASAKGHEKIVQMLLNKGAKVDAPVRSAYGSPLDAASVAGHEEVVQLLIDRGADVNAQSESRYCTALEAASTMGHEKVVKVLLENGADVNAPGNYCDNALKAASAQGHEKVVQMLRRHGAK